MIVVSAKHTAMNGLPERDLRSSQRSSIPPLARRKSRLVLPSFLLPFISALTKQQEAFAPNSTG